MHQRLTRTDPTLHSHKTDSLVASLLDDHLGLPRRVVAMLRFPYRYYRFIKPRELTEWQFVAIRNDPVRFRRVLWRVIRGTALWNAIQVGVVCLICYSAVSQRPGLLWRIQSGTLAAILLLAGFAVVIWCSGSALSFIGFLAARSRYWSQVSRTARQSSDYSMFLNTVRADDLLDKSPMRPSAAEFSEHLAIHVRSCSPSVLARMAEDVSLDPDARRAALEELRLRGVRT